MAHNAVTVWPCNRDILRCMKVSLLIITFVIRGRTCLIVQNDLLRDANKHLNARTAFASPYLKLQVNLGNNTEFPIISHAPLNEMLEHERPREPSSCRFPMQMPRCTMLNYASNGRKQSSPKLLH